MLVATVALVVLLPLCFLMRQNSGEGRWRIAEEELKVNGVRSNAGLLSFFVPLSLQPTNSVLHLKPVHYLRPYRLEERIDGDWVPVPVRRKLYWAEMSSANGLQRCLCRFVFRQRGGEFRSLLVYRYRNRWDFLRRRMATRLPDKLSRWVLPRRADGAVWTQPFTIELESENIESVDDGMESGSESIDEIPATDETSRRLEASSIRVTERVADRK